MIDKPISDILRNTDIELINTQRIMPIASQTDGAMPNEVKTYIDNLIYEKL